MAQKARISVSAEVFGKYNMKEAFVAKVIPKNQEIKNKIKERISNAFMFITFFYSVYERILKA